MDLLKVTEDLIRFRTETGNAAEIDKALEYIKTCLPERKQKSQFSGRKAFLRLFSSVTGTLKTMMFCALDILMLSPRKTICFSLTSKTAKCLGAARWT